MKLLKTFHMSLLFKVPTFLFSLFVITLGCRGQESTVVKGKNDTIVPMHVIRNFKEDINTLNGNVKLLQYELRARKEAEKIDSLRYGSDSLVTIFAAKSGKPLMRILQKFVTPANNHEDSIVSFYNKNGLIEYHEMWQIKEISKAGEQGRFERRKMKLTCRRYEYDDRNRLIREVVDYPTPKTMEYTYTYDSTGKQVRNERSISSWKFWGKM